MHARECINHKTWINNLHLEQYIRRNFRHSFEAQSIVSSVNLTFIPLLFIQQHHFLLAFIFISSCYYCYYYYYCYIPPHSMIFCMSITKSLAIIRTITPYVTFIKNSEKVFSCRLLRREIKLLSFFLSVKCAYVLELLIDKWSGDDVVFWGEK